MGNKNEVDNNVEHISNADNSVLEDSNKINNEGVIKVPNNKNFIPGSHSILNSGTNNSSVDYTSPDLLGRNSIISDGDKIQRLRHLETTGDFQENFQAGSYMADAQGKDDVSTINANSHDTGV